MTSSLLALILFISSSFSVSAVDPVGLKLRITNNSREMLKEQAVAMFQEQLVNQLIPQQVETFGFTLRNFDLHQLGAIRGDFNFQTNSRLKFEIMDSTFSVSLNISCLAFSEFRLTVTAENVNATMEVSLTRSEQGRLAVHMPVCEAPAGKFLPVTNGNEWPRIGTAYFPKIFSFLFCWLVGRFVLPAVNGKLDTTPMTAEVFPDFNISIDYTLTKDVQVTDTAIDLSFKGLFYRPGDNINPPNPAVEPAFNETTRMAYVGVSEFLLNSAATSFYNAGALVYPVGWNLLKVLVRIRQFFTQPWHLTDPIDVEIRSTEAPSFSITEDHGVTLNLTLKLQDTVPGTVTSRNVLSVSTRCGVSATISTNGTHLVLPHNNVSCDIVTRNHVRQVLVKPLTSLMNRMASYFLEGLFKNGLRIPLPEGINFTQQMVKYHNGFVVLGGDLSLTPPGRQGLVNTVTRSGK